MKRLTDKVMKSFLTFLFVSIFLVGIVFAAHLITMGGGALVGVNQDVGNIYNISVNNADAFANATANITYVNVTIPGTFKFISASNGTDSISNFTNSSSVLVWSNLNGLVMNLTTQYFWFNATASTPGNYNLSVATLNATGAYYSNISVTVNDTTAPSSVQFNSPTLSTGVNLSQTSIPVNVTVSDNVALSTIMIYLYNSTTFLNSTNITSNSALFNFTVLSNGIYYLNATANDTSNNRNATGTGTRIITLDTTSPSISLSGTTTASSVDISINITEALSGVNGTCITTRGTISGTNSTQSISEGSLSCESSYTYNVTCYDFAGNSANAAATYTTQSCSPGSNNGGGVTSAPASSGWKSTTMLTAEQFTTGATRELATNERFSFSIGGSEHTAGIRNLTNSTATIEVASTPVTATMTVGEVNRFDLTSDGYYDIAVILDSISGNKAQLTIKSIHEKIVAKVPKAEQTDEAPVSPIPQETTPTEPPVEQTNNSTGTLFIIVVVIVIIAIVWFIIAKMRKGKKHNHSGFY